MQHSRRLHVTVQCRKSCSHRNLSDWKKRCSICNRVTFQEDTDNLLWERFLNTMTGKTAARSGRISTSGIKNRAEAGLKPINSEITTETTIAGQCSTSIILAIPLDASITFNSLSRRGSQERSSRQTAMQRLSRNELPVVRAFERLFFSVIFNPNKASPSAIHSETAG